ncbi:hypothetical protein QMA09_12825 [Planococcus sp. APC 3906]|uniref:hypothetical protein n=1 Tax=Planococcus sp. APC 3906 TaxID=3035194 RepID=UPI0025B2FCF4|nr:hypothetical protein [Planococcus sp. APC 3906]MDN3451075.1 hypothetical protein [Planococcus sp. APC 3906]
MKVKVNSRMPHPYEKYENTELWKKIDQALDELVENQDIKEITKREYIVVYICKKLIETKELK